MAGLYVHIPFCRSKCAYCDFYSLPLKALDRFGGRGAELYREAIIREFGLRHGEIKEQFTTIYIGGGTPTALPQEELKRLIDELRTAVAAHNRAMASGEKPGEIREFTIEANPEDITPENIAALKDSGIDRISIGIQSFDNCQLGEIRRLHEAALSLQALRNLRDSGINYSADLIYGLPGQSAESWRQQLKTLLDFNPPHFSAYLLSYEPGTRLYARMMKGEVTEAPEELAETMYGILTSEAKLRGYNHYEISNFSLSGYEARHNSSYWNLTPYLGLGCSAHSFDGSCRSYNPSDLKSYLESLGKGETTAVIDEETEINCVNDYIITSLRTSRGLSLRTIEEKWGPEFSRQLQENVAPRVISGDFISDGRCFYIAESRWLTSDAILRDIILD